MLNKSLCILLLLQTTLHSKTSTLSSGRITLIFLWKSKKIPVLTIKQTWTFSSVVEIIVWRESCLEEGCTTCTSHNFLHKVTELHQPSCHLTKLCELCLVELSQTVCVTLLNLAQAHVTDSMTHLSYVHQGWPKWL